jgi:hypothetical protein
MEDRPAAVDGCLGAGSASAWDREGVDVDSTIGKSAKDERHDALTARPRNDRLRANAIRGKLAREERFHFGWPLLEHAPVGVDWGIAFGSAVLVDMHRVLHLILVFRLRNREKREFAPIRVTRPRGQRDCESTEANGEGDPSHSAPYSPFARQRDDECGRLS